MIEVVETAACEISPRPASIPHNLPPVVLNTTWKQIYGEPRYVLSNGPETDWTIVDRMGFSREGSGTVAQFVRRPKSEWSAADIYSFLSHLNSRQ